MTAKEEFWTVRGVPADVRKRFSEAAKKKGCTVGELARAAMEQVADRILEGRGDTLPFEAETELNTLERQMETVRQTIANLKAGGGGKTRTIGTP